MKYSNSKEINNIVKLLVKKYGCIVKRGSKHCRVYDESTDKSLTVSSTPSDRNASKAFLRDIEKYFLIKVQ